MAENSGIEWTHHTFNPWIGCTKVSPACDHCYAEAWDKRYGGGKRWGASAPRTRTSASNWAQPMRWDRQAAAAGTRFRVFCASLADVFDNQVPAEWRADLWRLIADTHHLDWLLLTKRPQNIAKMLPADWMAGLNYPNVWLGMTAENQQEYDRRGPSFFRVPAAVHFLSCEPLLGSIDLRLAVDADEGDVLPYPVFGKQPQWPNEKLDWVIVGGESGPAFRPDDANWYRDLRDQCDVASIPFLFKQWAGPSQQAIKKLGRELDGVVHDGYPNPRRGK